jgi:hypothetical protein
MSARSQAPADAAPNWVSFAPPRLTPWFQLMRLDRPIATGLL